MRVDLKVPFKDKDEAKKLGAKWDSEKKTWYTFFDSKIEIFFNWLEDIGTDHDDISADYFYIAESERKCWDCKKRTKIFTFLLEKYKKVEAAEEEELNENYKTF